MLWIHRYQTAHVAFRKSCYFLEIEVREIPATIDGIAVPSRIHDYIDSNTIAVVASNCGYAHGTIDDIQSIAEIAHSYNVGCHVDSWLGGYVNWFVEYLQKNPLLVDFRWKGVTSISADTHKYGYGPKGVSTLMLRPKKLFDYLTYKQRNIYRNILCLSLPLMTKIFRILGGGLDNGYRFFERVLQFLY